ncbi:MAG: lytic transglycosylase domain-containing protein [Desulfobacterales bacterium]|nr:lytic transglycosylase domain-containing protein [Desulfobacterales bacterium]
MYKDASGALCFTDSPSATHIDKLGARPIDKKRSKIKRSSAYDAIILRASRKHNISFSLIKAVIHAESGFNPKALSSKGAMGLMQLMPGNSTYMKIKNPYDPYENIMGGCTYLRKLLTLYKGDTRLALAAYNAGPSKVKQFGGVPPYPETKAYIAKVVRYKKIYTVSK